MHIEDRNTYLITNFINSEDDDINYDDTGSTDENVEDIYENIETICSLKISNDW